MSATADPLQSVFPNFVLIPFLSEVVFTKKKEVSHPQIQFEIQSCYDHTCQEE